MTNSELEAYYIGSGKSNAKYTLRYRIWDVNYLGEKYLADYYIKTLTTKFDESVESAKKYLEGEGSSVPLEAEEFSLRPITKEKIDHNILRFGKYRDMTIEEVKEEDTDYLVWAAQNMDSKAHAKTIELIKEAVKDELVQAETDQSVDEVLEEDREQQRLSSRHVGTVGKRVELSLMLTGDYSWDGMYGLQTLYFFEDSDHNAFVWKTTSGFSREVPIAEGSSICSYKPVKQGEVVKVKATIKAHGEYEGQKQTTLTRVKLEK